MAAPARWRTATALHGQQLRSEQRIAPRSINPSQTMTLTGPVSSSSVTNMLPLAVPGRWRKVTMPQARTLRPWGTVCSCKAVSSRQRCQARAQQSQRVAAQGQAGGGVVEDDFFALGRLGQLSGASLTRGVAQQRGAVLGGGVPICWRRWPTRQPAHRQRPGPAGRTAQPGALGPWVRCWQSGGAAPARGPATSAAPALACKPADQPQPRRMGAGWGNKARANRGGDGPRGCSRCVHLPACNPSRWVHINRAPRTPWRRASCTKLRGAVKPMGKGS